MPEADGSVRIVAKFDSASLQKQISTLGKQIERQSAEFEKASAAASKLRTEYEAFVKTQAESVRNNASKTIEEEKKNISSLGAEYRKLTTERERLNSVAEMLKADGKEPPDLLRKEIEANASEISSIMQRINASKANIAKSEADIANADSIAVNSESAKKMALELEDADAKTKALGQSLEESKGKMSALQETAQRIPPSTEQTASAFQKIGNYIGRLAKRMLVLYMFRRIFTYIRNLIMSLSGLSVVTGVFSEFNNKMKEAYQNNTAIQGALAKLRGSLYAAFNPIYEAVVPALVTLINWLSKGIQYIAAFLSALSGKSLQENTAGAQKLAKAVGGVGSAAKEANKQLAQFDRLNTLSENNGGGGGGGSSGAADFTDLGKGIDLEWIERIKRRISPIIDDIKAIFGGLIDFVVGIFSGDWELAFDGAARVIEGFGSLVSHVIDGIVVPVFDGFYSRVEDIIDGLFEFIENKTGLDLTSIRKNVTYALDYMRFYIEGVAIQIGWIVQDLCNIVGDILRGDWQAAWNDAQQLMKDASVDIGAEAEKMAKKVGEEAKKASGDISKHSKSSHSSVADAATGVGEGLEAAGNASADFAETFVANMDAVRGSVASMNGAGVQAQVSPDGTGISFLSTFKTYAAKIFRMVFLTPHLFAGGGFPTTGSAFIAGEAGPELVGSFGGHNNSVVNEAQLVQAFRQASSEQVALMQQQNSLLAAILNKSGEVTFKPSSAAGRAFQQSINMYNRAMG